MREFKEFILKLKTRRNMFVFGNNFSDLCNLIIGYSCGVETFTKQNIDGMFNDWLLSKKLKKHTNTYWPDNIYEMADKDDSLAEEILFDLLDNFFESVS